MNKKIIYEYLIIYYFIFEIGKIGRIMVNDGIVRIV